MSKWTVDLRKADIVGALLLICFSLFAVYITTTWLPPNLPGDPGAAFFPRISLALVFIFSLILLIQRIRASRAEPSSPDNDGNTITIDLSKLIWTLVCSGLLVAGIAFIGFEIAAFAFLFVLLGMRTGRWGWSFITTVIAVIAMYFVFAIVLKVRLPLLFLPPYLNIF